MKNLTATKGVVVLCSFLIQFVSLAYSQRLPPIIASNAARRTAETETLKSRYTYRQSQVLDSARNIVVTWEPNFTTKTIVFNVTAPIKGNGGGGSGSGAFVFGLSKTGHVGGSDLIVVNLDELGNPQILDMFGENDAVISVDTVQNWKLMKELSLFQNGRVFISVERDLETCDEQDLPINNDMVRLIYGFTSGVFNAKSTSLIFVPSGSSREYLLDPIVSPAHQNKENVKSFRISRKMLIPSRKTSYWCTVHKGPSFSRKQHITGFMPYFGDETARQRIHHAMLYRCIVPPAIDPSVVFEKFIGHPGEECYLEAKHYLPTHLCTEIVHNYAIGGEGFTFPDDVGIVLGETQNEYFMLEVHTDNPEKRSDMVLEYGVDLQYTPNLRPSDGSIMFIGSGVLGFYMVPPHTANFRHAGQCSPECTRQITPLSGMRIIASSLHAHAATKKIKLRHYRGNKELPPIVSDDNYDFSFQLIRNHADSPLILPGDRLVVECMMDTSSRNRTTLSGMSTNDEMCVTFLVFNKRVPYTYCSSEYPTVRIEELFKIRNMTWDRNLQERVVNKAANPNFRGKTLGRLIDENLKWTPERKTALEKEQMYGTHDTACPPVQAMATLAYVGLFVDTLTAGIFRQRQMIDNHRPTTKTVWTPRGPESELVPTVLRTAKYPVDAEPYKEPESRCRRRSGINRFATANTISPRSSR